jgi:radical SAM protein with 4Fe4S-binding SPASM domain
MVIASNGDVVACCRDLQHKTVLGNLFEQELVDIWNSEEYQNLRTALVEKDPDRMSACQGRDLPYDADKFRVAHLAKTAVNRLGILR